MIITTYKKDTNESINNFLPVVDTIEKRFGVVVVYLQYNKDSFVVFQ